MTSSRLILALLGIIFLFIVILSSSRILDSLRRRVGLVPKQDQVKDSQVTITPGQENSKDEGKEIPQTGPAAIVYLLLGGGLLSGIAIKRIKH